MKRNEKGQFVKGSQAKDISGQKFGRLTAIKRVGKTNQRRSIWLCNCECGNTTKVSISDLISGSTKSCGCLREDVNLKHGGAKLESRLYNIWKNMKKRCYNPHREDYKWYGDKGVEVCEEWRASFAKFREWAKSNGYSEDLTIDRINGDGDYRPENCRWVSTKKQALNRSDNINLTYNGETQTLKEWSNELEIGYQTLFARIKRLGWPIEKALTEPLRGSENQEKLEKVLQGGRK